MKHTQGKMEKSASWHGETSEAGIDHDGDKDFYTAKSFVRHEDESIDFTISVEIEGKAQDEAGEQAMLEVNHLASLRNASDGMTTEEVLIAIELFKRMKGDCTLPANLKPEEAMRYIEHGREIVELLQHFRTTIFMGMTAGGSRIDQLLSKAKLGTWAKLEGTPTSCYMFEDRKQCSRGSCADCEYDKIGDK